MKVRRFAFTALLGLALLPVPTAWAAGDAAPAQPSAVGTVTAGGTPTAQAAAPMAAPAAAATATAAPATTTSAAAASEPATPTAANPTEAPSSGTPAAAAASTADASAPASPAAPTPAAAPAAQTGADASTAPGTTSASATPADQEAPSAQNTASSASQAQSPASARPDQASEQTAPANAASSTAPAAAPDSSEAATNDQADTSADQSAASSDDNSDQSQSSTLDLLNEDNSDSDTSDGGADAAQTDNGDEGSGTASDAAQANQGDNAVPAAPTESDAAALTPPQEAAPTAPTASEEQGSDLFPSSPGIEKQKAFWIKIFTRYNSHQGVIHDGRIALPVYEAVDLTGLHYRAQRRYVRHAKRVLAARLRELAEAVKTGKTLDAKQQALLAKLPAGSSPRDIREFAENLRFQRGLADRFRDGLVRSGALLKPVRAILARYGVPKDLVYLPHVESSFNNKTRSKFGAAGIWQFTRSTGRLFMMVNYEVDERLDPIIASEAAAKFLRQNYDRLGTWPLAITAYNHGPQSMERIVRRLHTHNLAEIIKNYDGYLFGFASKNFYAEFLAAREVATHYEKYFGPLTLEPTLHFAKVDLPAYTDVGAVAKALGIDEAQLRALNPALRSPIWSGAKYIPPKYTLRIPPDKKPAHLLAALASNGEHDKQKRSLYVRVARGDTLYDIGRRNHISWRAIAAANNIDSYHRLMPGQKLILPWNGKVPPRAVVAAVSPPPAQPAKVRAVDPPKQPAVVGAQVVAHIPLQASAPSQGSPTGSGATNPLANHFQNLRIKHYNAARQRGEIVAAYGETVGGYAEWAGVTASEIRRLNRMRYGSVLRPGETYTIPLDAVTPDQFQQRRLAFHRAREKNFFAEYDIKEKVKVEVHRGQSPWDIAQNNNVPMWLFYRENPQLLTEPMRVGMEVILPVLETDGQDSR